MTLGEDKRSELHFMGRTGERCGAVSRTKAKGEHMQMVYLEGVNVIL